jgi:hypothetical protein
MSITDGLMNQTIDAISSVTINQYNDKTLSTKYEDVKCRWQETIGRTVNKDGEEVSYTVTAWIPAKYDDIDYDWRIERDYEIYTVVGITKHISLQGEIDHIRLFLR